MKLKVTAGSHGNSRTPGFLRMRKLRRLELASAWTAFAILLVTYWLSVPPTVSFWDCPEYVSAAYLLEVGHPPGNPVWMLVSKMATLLAPAPRYAALAINLSSGLFTAFAGFFLARTFFSTALWIQARIRRNIGRRRHLRPSILAAAGALSAALFFGWADSLWFSAVEAEVYALSIFFTSLCLWLMVRWTSVPTSQRGRAWRILILIAYIFGLSVGVHQLNLLCIPALAIIWGIKRGIRKPATFILIFLLSLGAVACVLLGMMPSTIALAAQFELFAVNKCGLPWLSGVAAYVIVLAAALLLALAVTARSSNHGSLALAVFPAIFLSGIFIIGDNFAAGAAVSAIAAILLSRSDKVSLRRLNLAMWMLTMLLTGYSAYALIPVRGGIPSPANAQLPGQPFSFATYQAREQYGSKPLLYGATPYSRPMYEETRVPGKNNPQYLSYKTDNIHPLYFVDDSTHTYRQYGWHSRPITTPELDMWFPRLTGTTSANISCYDDWIGMNPSTMEKLAVTEAFDSTGRAVAREYDGVRIPRTAYRPTYAQHLEWLASYQIGYMYFRYLLWNFSGRQNDIPSQGEVQAGNFITGFPVIDDAMLGTVSELPPHFGENNPGHNRYFLLPFILGLLGAGWLICSRRRGQQAFAVTLVLFIMSGIAIVVYLNQGPGEPRERDYSFLGSYLAFALWIGFGAIALCRAFKSYWPLLGVAALAGWFLYENIDDHNRSGRTVAARTAENILNAAPQNAILFVDGDNYTFPLWYAQEVEGVRRDVRVINLSYLASAQYAANQLYAWRDAAPMPSLISEHTILSRRLRSMRFNPANGDTIPASALVKALAKAPNATVKAEYVEIPRRGAESFIIPMKLLSQSGAGTSINFRRLMILNILAANEERRQPQPVAWLRSVPASFRLGIESYRLSPWLFGVQYQALSPKAAADSIAAALEKLRTPNPPFTNPYMDYTPAAHVGAQRAALIRAARLLLRQGDKTQAYTAITKADRPLGEHPLSFGTILSDDSVFQIRITLADVMDEIADSLKGPQAIELRARAKFHREEAEKKKKAWQHYRQALPPNLRQKMAPPI